MAARDLRGESDQLNNRVTTTDAKIGKFEDLAKKDDSLTIEAKEKVGQAKADSLEAQKQVQKAMNEVKAIRDELDGLKDIDVANLDELGNIID